MDEERHTGIGIAEVIFGQYYRYRKPACLDLMEMFRQGSNLVKGIDAPFAANEDPKVATARLSTQPLALTTERIHGKFCSRPSTAAHFI